MSALLTTLLFAASATASVTTSLILPGGGSDDSKITYVGSVVGVNNQKTTLAIAYANDTDTSIIGTDGNPTETVTISGTSFGIVVTTTEESSSVGYTVSLGCQFPTETAKMPTCTYSYGGPAYWSSFCSDYTDFATASDNALPSYCQTGSTIPDSVAITTITADDRSSLATNMLIITAGEEKLGAATTGAAASTTGPKPTGLTTVKGSGSASQTPTGTGASATAGSTGAAVPMATLAPALMGLGAAVAAFF